MSFVAVAIGASALLGGVTAKKQQDAARKQAEEQAMAARLNAQRTAQQAQENAAQLQQTQALAAERERLSKQAEEFNLANTKLANQEVSIDLTADSTDPTAATKRRKQFFSSTPGSGSGGLSI